MQTIGRFVKLSLDDSALDRAFEQINTRIDRQEEMIHELQRQMKDRPTRSELKDVNDNLQKLIDDKNKETNKQIDTLIEGLENKLKDLETTLENRMLDTANMMNLTIQQKFDELENRNNNGDTKMSDFIERLQALEETTFNNGKKLHLTREAVQQIASSICYLNNTNAILDNTLPDTLKAAVGTVTTNFKDIFDQLNKLKDRVSNIALKERRAPPQVIEKPVQQGNPLDIDISNIHPYPSVTAHWRDAPDLPPINQFMNIGEVVDYIYRMVPKLQAHLTAMQGKIVENANDILGKVDKSLVEKMFEKFQAVIGEMAGRVDELKDCIEETATRDEINAMIEDIFNSMTQGGQTAIGRVRCIACGREIPQVTGATSEEDATRMLGQPTNSYAGKGGTTNLGLLYAKKDGMDSAIIESPRSIRPFKPQTARPKTPR
ncbi:hypothetical protein TVAG_342600 [Trichomonas vaginalis G3]|uniref:Uncharacterized protein n=1 Tax=Trichomonas vaginalis (strain ATCC PRA-98 / G3) TaxID=412133 RepID=A2EJM2_TRIV3|nr:hypothetical protein TVAGG3_0579280 [Trichomonas vaginalis G3]EAY07096.1 hypothetical protein TVAG_342600 [Trichomonas vaginalis G3]KAI5522446.1 hypothetical protein TVAGG3_0579280 [Trichomonas vaginalis G3]|eukprot:XP_001319319.1 hypothetical protein [Trichomonas vaginalis G3]